MQEIALNLQRVGKGSDIVFEAVAGQKYYIEMEDIWDVQGVTDFYAVQILPPANDNFEDAISVDSSSSATLKGNFVSATRQPGEPNLGPDFGGGSVWYRWKAATFGTVSLNSWNTSL